MPSVRLDTRRDGVAVCTLDVAGASVNVISSSVFEEIEAIVPTVENDPSIRAVVLSSGKPDNFIAGGDLGELRKMATPEEAEAFARRGHALLDRIAVSSKPFVAAIHGSAIGGGLETALACHARIATDHPRTILGLPEVMVGLLPGAGGTQRLPRLIGLEKSLPMLLAGKRIRVRRALHYGLIDGIASGDVVSEAANVALRLVEGRAVHRRTRSLRRRVVEFAPLRAMMLRRAKTRAGSISTKLAAKGRSE